MFGHLKLARLCSKIVVFKRQGGLGAAGDGGGEAGDFTEQVVGVKARGLQLGAVLRGILRPLSVTS